MVSENDLVEFALKLDGASERRSGPLRIFERGEKIFLIIEAETNPLRIETRCDRRLGRTLQERYESVMGSRSLGRNGIEIICSGQLSAEELCDLVRHGYEMSVSE